MKLSNIEMQNKIEQLKPILNFRDKLGYAAARNTRKLNEACQEYLVRKDELVNKYGEPVLDKDGNDTGQVSLSTSSPNFPSFIEELTPIAEIKHDVEIFTLPIEEAIGVLSGNELLDLDWMFTEETEEA